MFTWICPQCGREVPPAYTECPDCAKKAEAPDAAAPPQSEAPVQPQPANAPISQPQYAPPQAQPAAQPYPPAAVASRGLPTWLLALLFAVGFVGVGAGIYWLVGRGTSAKPTASVESPAAKPGTKTSPYQKYIEISGIRFMEDGKKKPQVRFAITNHSSVDFPEVGGNVTVWGRTRNSEEDAAGTFSFKTELKGFESKDITVPLATKKELIELPDWQNVSTDVQITSPAQ